jgi:hypothetical protein
MRESGTPKPKPRPIPKPVSSVSSSASASYGSGIHDRGGVYANVSNDLCVRGLGSGKGCACWFGSWRCRDATGGLSVRRVLSEVRDVPSKGESDIVRLKSTEAVRLISSGDIRVLCCSDVSSLDAPL